MNHSGPKSAIEPTSNRACDACRVHKVRCLPNTDSSIKSCQRCVRTDRQCLFTAPQKRKQKKRTDTRVAELEREVQAMRVLFQTKADANQDSPEKTNGAEIILAIDSMQLEAQKGSDSNSSDYLSVTPESTSVSSDPISSDVISRGIISLPAAIQLFNSFTTKFLPLYPCLNFPPTATAIECRTSKPTLFLAILAAAATDADPELYSALNTEILIAYAERTVMRHEKNLELVQAMIVCSVWYYPPGEFVKLKFYEFIALAASMAMDIGLGRNPKSSRARRGIGEEETGLSGLGDEEREKRRTFLVCYMNSVAVSMVTRRPNMLRYSSWTDECVESLAQNPQINILDRRLVSWVKLMKIAEDITSAFHFDDPGNTIDLSEPLTQIMLLGYEKELKSWKEAAEFLGMNDVLLIQYSNIQQRLHEVALYDDHPPEDLTPPLQISKILSIYTLPSATQTHLAASAAIITSAQSMLDMFLSMPIPTLRILHIFNYVRAFEALIALVKLYISSKSPTSKIGSVLDSQSLKLDFYLTELCERMLEALGDAQYRSPCIFLRMWVILKIWYEGQKNECVFIVPDLRSLVGRNDNCRCWQPEEARELYFGMFERFGVHVKGIEDWRREQEIECDGEQQIPLGDGLGEMGVQGLEGFDDPMMVGVNSSFAYMGSEYGFDGNLDMLGMPYNTVMDSWPAAPGAVGAEYPVQMVPASVPAFVPEGFRWDV